MYTKQQINGIKRFCCTDNGDVLGMNKTNNLGDFNVTSTVYKDKSVIKRTTNESVSVLHIFIKISQQKPTVVSCMLSPTICQIKKSAISPLDLNEELAFKCAIKRCFHGCTHVLCTRHLKENTNRHMENIIGYPKKDRDEIVDAIYGPNG